MHERHTNKLLYFQEQGITTSKHVIPYINEVMKIDANTSVLEIGCGEGGNLEPFVAMGCKCRGVDINERKINIGNEKFAEIHPGKDVKLLFNNIYNLTAEDLGQYDLIMLRDVIEHLPNQNEFMAHMKQFLTPNGKAFFGFPPWFMPFGGHQQTCKNKWASKLPYYHILPKPIYRGILRAFGESDRTIESLMEIYDTRITIERYNRILKNNNYKIDKRTYWFINPNYETKFGLKPRKKIPILGDIPYLRNFTITCYYSVISDKRSDH